MSPYQIRLEVYEVDAAGPHDLAGYLADVNAALARLTVIRSELTTDLADAVGIGGIVTDLAGRTWKVKRKKGKVEWDHDALSRLMLTTGRDARRVDEETGEVESEGEAVARVIVACAGIGYWRVTALQRFGIDADEYRATHDGPPEVVSLDPP